MGYSLALSRRLLWVVMVMILHFHKSKACIAKEKFALLQIKKQFSLLSPSPNHKLLPSWSSDNIENCCLWERVRCDPSSGHITKLSLGSLLPFTYFYFSRPLNMTDFRDLEELQYLDLSQNILNIEDESICELRNLRVLNMSDNGIQGEIANCFGNLNFLTKLDLSNNAIQGDFPSGICNLKRLQVLDISENQLDSFPTCICKLIKLQGLHLQWNFLKGSIPNCIGKLACVKVFDLSNNMFTGSIPSTISNLTNLEGLYMDGNFFEGKFPLNLLSKLAKLRYLSLSHIQLEIAIDDSVWMSSFQLESLFLTNCSLNQETKTFFIFLSYQHHISDLRLPNNDLAGSFPISFSQSNSQREDHSLKNSSAPKSAQFSSHRYIVFPSQLEILDLSKNRFSGKLLENVGLLLSNLKFLDLSNNNFEGPIPTTIGEMKGLERLDLSQNQFDGEVPKQLFNGLNNLSEVFLSHNKLHGEVFPNFMNLPQLKYLFLDNNRFKGRFEDSLLKSSNLYELHISNNEISGQIPSWIGEFKQLAILSFEENILHGPIPSSLCNISLLFYLDLSNNRFSGRIPSCNGTLLQLQYMYLKNNNLSGHVPHGLSTSSKLQILDLRGNQLVGGIPLWVGQLSNLLALQLGNNKLQGGLPSQLCHLQNLNVLDVASNQLSGIILPCLKDLSFGSTNGDFTVLEGTTHLDFVTKGRDYSYVDEHGFQMSGLDLSYNQLSGQIPSELGYLKATVSLNLSHNKLNGFIPETFSSLRNIESLDLSFNNLSGPIPLELVKLTFLEDFNVSYNNLSGRVPTIAQFGSFGASSYLGNPFLSGYDQGRSSIHGETSNATFGEDEHNTKFDWGLFIWSFAPSCFIFLLGTVSVFYNNPQWLDACVTFVGEEVHCCFHSSY